MGKAFDLTANLHVTGPYGVKAVIRTLQNQIKGVPITLDLRIPPNVTAFASSLQTSFGALNKTIMVQVQQLKTLTAELNAACLLLPVKRVQQRNHMVIATKGAADSSKKMGDAITDTNAAIQEFGRVSGLAFRRYVGFTVATTLTFGFMRATKEAMRQAIQFERELMRKVVEAGS